MKEISSSCVHRRGPWVVSAFGTAFYGKSIGRSISEWGYSRRDHTTVTKVNSAIIIGSVDQRIIHVERDLKGTIKFNLLFKARWSCGQASCCQNQVLFILKFLEIRGEICESTTCLKFLIYQRTRRWLMWHLFLKRVPGKFRKTISTYYIYVGQIKWNCFKKS